jgi:hypothetical protein
MKKEELIETLNEIGETTKDYNTFAHIFSDDDGIRTLAELNKLVGRVRLLLKMSELKEIRHPKLDAIKETSVDRPVLVKVRPCADEYKDKTFVGFLIGEVALGSSISISDDKISCEWAQYNPAMYVPEIGKIIYGCGSWWSEIKSVDELKQITNEDIENVWYVKALKEQMEADQEVDGQSEEKA